MQFVCPLPAALTTIPDVTCPQQFGQIQMFALRQMAARTAVTPTFATVTDLTTKSKWTTALAAVDNTKIVLTPLTTAVVIPPGTPISEEGNNNNTIDGIPMLVGMNTVQVTGKYLNLPASIATILRTLTPYSALMPGMTNLEMFMFNDSGQIIHSMDKTTPTIPVGIPVYNWVVPAVGTEGLNKPNTHNVQFDLKPDWDERLTVTTPTTFDPREL